MIGKFKKVKRNVKLFLCKPNRNRTTIANLSEAYQISRTRSRGNIGELSFNLPTKKNDNNVSMEFVSNKNLDLIKERFIIRFEVNQPALVANKSSKSVEYYIVDNISKIMDDKDYISVTCYSLGYELKSKLIKDYSVTSYTARQVMVDILKETIWNIGFIDAQFDLKYRTIEISSSVLDAINQVAEKYGALIVWDTVNRQISLYDPEVYGINKGFKTKLGKLMTGVQQNLDFSEFYTRLKLFGKDGLSVQSVNPAGTNFIQDFTYFIYPFEQDSQGNVIKHSHYMEDDLCIAIKRYENLVATNTPTFNSYLEALKGYQTQLNTKQVELSTLKTQLDVLEDQLATYNAINAGSSTYTPNTQLINQISAKKNEITNKNSEITSVNNQIAGVNQSIKNMATTLKMENNFSSTQLIELNQFIFEGELSDENYTNAQDLWDDGKKQFEKVRTPKIIVDLSIVNFYEILNDGYDRQSLTEGDIVTVEHEILGINIKAHVTEIVEDYESGTINLTVSNAEDLLTDKEKFMKDHQKSIGTSNTVDMNKYKWDDAKATADDVTLILNNTWDAVARNISAGINEDVEISRRGIIIRDPNDPLKMLIMQHGQIALTNNGGNTWQLAIDPSGVYAQRLVGKILLGNKLIITDDTGSFTIEGNLLTVKDASGVTRIQLGQYAAGKYGLKIISKLGNVLLDENGIVQTYTTQVMDNVDQNYPLRFKIYIPSTIISVGDAQLNFSLERFRAYSTGAESTTIPLNSTYSGGGWSNTTSSDSIQLTSTAQTYISGSSETNGTYIGSGGHNHGIVPGTLLAVYGTNNTVKGYVDWQPSGNHSHPIVLGQHSHSITVPTHYHSFYVPDHSHTIYMPSHSHAIQYGIYESSYATGVTIYVDGVYRAGTYYASENNVNLTSWLSTPGWHTIELRSSQLGRINAALFMRTFLGA